MPTAICGGPCATPSGRASTPTRPVVRRRPTSRPTSTSAGARTPTCSISRPIAAFIGSTRTSGATTSSNDDEGWRLASGSESMARLSEQQVQQFRRDGVLFPIDLFRRDEVDALRGRLEALARAEGGKLSSGTHPKPHPPL